MKLVRFLKRGMVLLLQCVVAVEIFIIIAVFPVLFDNLSFNLSEYIQAILFSYLLASLLLRPIVWL